MIRRAGQGKRRRQKIRAEDNPWYLLATLYGKAGFTDDELKAKNRAAWNRYFAANLDEETRTKLIEEKRHTADELTAFSPEELQKVASAFARRCERSAKTELALPASDDRIDFSNVKFEQNAFFGGYLFSRNSSFQGAAFSKWADFDGAAFSGWADFHGTAFSDLASFDGAIFSGVAVFGGATFSKLAWFAGAAFSSNTSFDGAAFSSVADFRGATFSRNAGFRKATFGETTRFVNAEMKRGDFFRGSDIRQGASSILQRQASSRHCLARHYMAAPPQEQG